MTTEEKRYIDLIEDVNSGEISIIDAKDILGDKYTRWLRAYNSYNEARIAYKEYQLALENYKKVQAEYENSVLSVKQQKAKVAECEKARIDTLLKNKQFVNQVYITSKAIRENFLNGYLNGYTKKVYTLPQKVRFIQTTEDDFWNSRLKGGWSRTPEGHIKLADGLELKSVMYPVYIGDKEEYYNWTEFYNKYKQQRLAIEQAAKAYYDERRILAAKKDELQDALDKKNIAEVNYQDYTLLKIIGIL